MKPGAMGRRVRPAEDSADAQAQGLESTGAGPRASVSGLRMGKAGGEEMGQVGWRQMIQKEL